MALIKSVAALQGFLTQSLLLVRPSHWAPAQLLTRAPNLDPSMVRIGFHSLALHGLSIVSVSLIATTGQSSSFQLLGFALVQPSILGAAESAAYIPEPELRETLLRRPAN